MYAYNPVSKQSQLHRVRVKPTQKQMGAISAKVRAEVRERSGGVCEVRMKCVGAFAREMAHITGRKQIKRKTTAEDLLDTCVPCHKFLDETPEGIKMKRRLAE